MTQEQAVLERTPDAAVRRSLSDRPVFMRYLVHTGRFFRTKPLGGAGVVIIIACVIAGVFGNQLERYDPETIGPALSGEQWAMFENAVTATIAFLDTARTARNVRRETA